MIKLFTLVSSGSSRVISADIRQGFSQPITDIEKNYPSVAAASGSTNTPHGRMLVIPNSRKAIGSTGSGVSKPYMLSDINNTSTYYEPAVSFSGSVWAIAASAQHYAIAGDNPFLYVFESNTDAFIQVVTTGLGRVLSAAFSSDGALLAVVHATAPYLRVYKTSDWTYTQPANNAIGLNRTAVCFSKDSSLLLTVGTTGPYLSVMNVSTLELVRSETSASFYSYAHAQIKHHPLKSDTLIISVGAGSAPTRKALYDYNILTGDSVDIIPLGNSFNVMSFDIAIMTGFIYVAHSAWDILGVRSFTSIFNLHTYERVGSIECIDLHYSTNQAINVVVVEDNVSSVSGTVRDIDNAPAMRTVTAHNRVTGNAVARTKSDALTGNYSLILPNTDEVDIQFHTEDGELLNDLFYARVIPELLS